MKELKVKDCRNTLTLYLKTQHTLTKIEKANAFFNLFQRFYQHFSRSKTKIFVIYCQDPEYDDLQERIAKIRQ